MGIDILYFMDHDLPFDDFRKFCTEFKKRVKGNAFILDDYDTSKPNIPATDIWHIGRFSDYEDEIHLSYNGKSFQCQLDVYKNTVEIRETEINGDSALDGFKWNHMVDMFERDFPISGKEWADKMIDICRKYFAPILHSTKILLTADSSSYRHETLAFSFLMEQGKSIDEALELNKSFSPPCKVWRNDEAFGREYEDYYDIDASSSIGALFVFDF